MAWGPLGFSTQGEGVLVTRAGRVSSCSAVTVAPGGGVPSHESTQELDLAKS